VTDRASFFPAIVLRENTRACAWTRLRSKSDYIARPERKWIHIRHLSVKMNRDHRFDRLAVCVNQNSLRGSHFVSRKSSAGLDPCCRCARRCRRTRLASACVMASVVAMNVWDVTTTCPLSLPQRSARTESVRAAVDGDCAIVWQNAANSFRKSPPSHADEPALRITSEKPQSTPARARRARDQIKKGIFCE